MITNALKSSFYMIVMVLILLGENGCTFLPQQQGSGREKYVLFEPLSIGYMEYALQYQDMSGFIDGVESRCSKENSNLKNYLTQLRKKNDTYNRSTPYVFFDRQEWINFCQFVKTKKYKPYFYIEIIVNEDGWNKQSKQKQVGLILLDTAGKEFKKYILEEQTSKRIIETPSI